MSQTITSNNTAAQLDEQHSSGQFLTFILEGEEYGVDILRVQEIKGWDAVTPIPNTPDYVKGVINLRGAIIPIIDLRRRFNLHELTYGPTTVVIILKIKNQERERTMGVVVDAVSDVYNITSDDLQPPPEFGGVINIEYLRGLASVADKMIIVLDIDHLLNANDMKLLNSTSERLSSGVETP